MRSGLAALIVGISLMVASFSWSGFALLRTSLNPDRSEDIADELISNTAVRSLLADQISDSIDSQLPDAIPISKDSIDSLSAESLDDPEVIEVIKDSFIKLHQQVLEGGTEPVEVDSVALTAAGKSFLTKKEPAAALIPNRDFIDISIPTSGLSFVSGFRSLLQRVVPIGALISVIGIAFGFILARNRSTVLRRVAYWAFGVSAFWLIVGIAIPKLLSETSSSATPIASAIINIFFGAMTGPALLTAGLGVALFVASVLWPKAKQNKHLDKISNPQDNTREPREALVREPQQRETYERNDERDHQIRQQRETQTRYDERR